MKYNELENVKQQGIFHFMEREFPNMTTEQMDILFLSKFGERTLAPIVEVTLLPEQDDMGWNTLAAIVLGMFEPKWKRFEEVFALEYSPKDAYFDTTTNTANYKGHSSNKSSRLDTEKEYTYESEEDGVPTTKTDSDNKGERSEKTRRQSVSDRHGNISSNTGKSIQIVLSDELELRRKNYITEVLADVAEQLTLSIYESEVI